MTPPPTITIAGIRSPEHLVHRACKALRESVLAGLTKEQIRHPPPDVAKAWDEALRQSSDLRNRTLRNGIARFGMREVVSIVERFVILA